MDFWMIGLVEDHFEILHPSTYPFVRQFTLHPCLSVSIWLIFLLIRTILA